MSLSYEQSHQPYKLFVIRAAPIKNQYYTSVPYPEYFVSFSYTYIKISFCYKEAAFHSPYINSSVAKAARAFRDVEELFVTKANAHPDLNFPSCTALYVVIWCLQTLFNPIIVQCKRN